MGILKERATFLSRIGYQSHKSDDDQPSMLDLAGRWSVTSFDHRRVDTDTTLNRSVIVLTPIVGT